MKWILAPLLLLMAVTVSADDAYQEGYRMGADSKAFMDGWRAANKEPSAPQVEKPSVRPTLKEFIAERDEARKLQEKQNTTEQLSLEWKATFVPEKGSRTDYIPKDDGFKVDNDGLSSELEFTVHEDGISATIRMSGGNIKKPETYEAAVLQYGTDMIVIASRYGAIKNIDKIEIYTLYPKMGIGFLNMTSAYAGDFVIKVAAESNKSIPAASSLTFPLRLKE